MDPVTVRSGGTDRLQRGENVARRFLLTDTPHRVVTNRVAAMELSHPVQLVIVRWHSLLMRRRRPRLAADRSDRQRPELVERETTIRSGVRDLFDPVEFGVTVRVVRFLPRLGPLERDLVLDQDLAASFPPELHHPHGVVTEELDQLADRPTGERLSELLQACRGRRDDERDIVNRDLAGTGTRPLRVQRSHPHIVEPMDHLPDPILGCRDQPGDHRDRVPTR